MEYQRLNNTATKSKLGLGMRFFSSKHKSSKLDDRGRAGPPEVEARSDATTKKVLRKDSSRERDGSAALPTPKSKNGGQGIAKSPTREMKLQPAALSPGSGSRAVSPRSQGSKSASPNNRAMAPKQSPRSSPRSSPKPDKRRAGFSPLKATKAVSPTSKAPPASILHKTTHYGHATPKSPAAQPTSPLPVYNMSSNPRVRFLSSGESVASTVESQVHLMAGANSVASSSCMSSSADHTNVFDRVLNMVMSEEHDRLAAMGMAGAHPTSAKQQKQHQQQNTNDRFSKVDAKAKAAVAAIPGSASAESEDDLGLAPPKRGDLAPIDMDTGVEIGKPVAPIDADTGLELGQHLGEGHLSPIDTDTGMEIRYTGGESEYHDTNDDNIDGKKWKKLNDSALRGVKGLNMKDSRRSRSYDERPKSSGSHQNRFSRSDSDEGPRRNNPQKKPSPGRKSGFGKIKIWDKASNELENNEWVPFDKEGTSRGKTAKPGRVSDLAAF